MSGNLKINKERCIGCGFCASICPDVFELEKDGKSKIKEKADFKKNEKCAKEAEEGCPAGAIETA